MIDYILDYDFVILQSALITVIINWGLIRQARPRLNGIASPPPNKKTYNLYNATHAMQPHAMQSHAVQPHAVQPHAVQPYMQCSFMQCSPMQCSPT